MLINSKRYSKNDLIKALIAFKEKHEGKLPTKQDWKKGKMRPSLSTFYRRFESLNDALKEADKFNSVREFEAKISENNEERLPSKKRRLKSAPKQQSGFRCPFCGAYTCNADNRYSSLTIILIMRFKDLLNSNNGGSYSEGVFDCIYKVFGVENQRVRLELKKAGYLEKFDQRHRKGRSREFHY